MSTSLVSHYRLRCSIPYIVMYHPFIYTFVLSARPSHNSKIPWLNSIYPSPNIFHLPFDLAPLAFYIPSSMPLTLVFVLLSLSTYFPKFSLTLTWFT
ncbi:hypothetical protein EI94DRAFT_1755248 [Lactarius quietus]|nr:hypothetical protein EI94DRAFT_1755248 [Lactarius quietus]